MDTRHVPHPTPQTPCQPASPIRQGVYGAVRARRACLTAGSPVTRSPQQSIFPGRASARSGTDGGLSADRRGQLVPGLRPGKMVGDQHRGTGIYPSPGLRPHSPRGRGNVVTSHLPRLAGKWADAQRRVDGAERLRVGAWPSACGGPSVSPSRAIHLALEWGGKAGLGLTEPAPRLARQHKPANLPSPYCLC